jgi:hypothetical protein
MLEIEKLKLQKEILNLEIQKKEMEYETDISKIQKERERFNKIYIKLLQLGKELEIKHNYNKQEYIPWATVFQTVLDAGYNIEYEIIYNTDGSICFGDAKSGYHVKTKITIDGFVKTMTLAVRGANNRTNNQPSSADIEKTQQRCLAKNLAVGFGCGLHIWSRIESEIEERAMNNETEVKSKITEEMCQAFLERLDNVVNIDELNDIRHELTVCKETFDIPRNITLTFKDAINKATNRINNFSHEGG